MDKTISLIYFWLKEKQLFKTCKTLEQEYGKEIKEPVGATSSLTKIIQTYQALLVVLSATSTVAKKKKKERVFPPGVWVCPEMEDILYNVYDRNELILPSIDALIDNTSEDVTTTIMDIDKSNENDQSKSDTVQNVDSLPPNNDSVEGVIDLSIITKESDSSDDDFQPMKTTTVNLCNGMVLESPYQVTKIPKEIKSNKIDRKHSKLVKEKQENTPDQKLTVDKSIESIIKEKTPKDDKSIESDEIKVKKKKSKTLLPTISPVFEGSNSIDHTAKKNKKRKLFEDMNGVAHSVEESPEVKTTNGSTAYKGSDGVSHVKKKKKRKSCVFEDINNGVENCNEGSPEVDVTNIGPILNGSNGVDHVKKKKKRKSCDFEVMTNGVENCIEDNPEVETVTKKKKKKHKNNIQQNIESEVIVKVNKKKSKFEEAEGKENRMELKKETFINSEADGNEFVLNNLSATLKKKKKKKNIDHT